MTVPQARAIDTVFTKLKDSVELLNFRLYSNEATLKAMSNDLARTNEGLIITKQLLDATMLQNIEYLKEIERYKKMEFEDRKALRRTTIGFAGAIALWLFVVIGSSVN